MKSVHRVLRDDHGGAAIEYALIAALIAASIILGLQTLGSSFAAQLLRFAKAMTGDA